MSTVYYTKLWLRAREDLEKILQLDSKTQNGKPLTDWEKAATLCLDLYYRYRNIIRRITECHDQLVQPQVRNVVGMILDFAIIRMLEIRKEIVKLTLSECSWPIKLLLNMKLTPDDITPKAPLYDLGTRMVEMERRQQIIQDTIEQQRLLEEAAEDDISMVEMSSTSALTVFASTSQMTSTSRRTDKENEDEEEVPVHETPEEKEARLALQAERKMWRDIMILLQKHERARVGRCIAIVAEKISIKIARMIQEGYDPTAVQVISEAEQNKAASVIQRAWRIFVDRRRVKDRRLKLDEACYMNEPSYRNRQVFDRYQELQKDTLDQQRKAAEACDQKYEDVKEKLETRRGPMILEETKEEIRAWMMHWFEVAGCFDYIPPSKYGGTKIVITGQARTAEEFGNQRNSKDKKKSKKKEPKEEEKSDSNAWIMPESKIFEHLMEANRVYVDEWIQRTDKILDPENPLIIEAMTDEICYHLQLEMRPFADEEMRPELKRLNKALALDRAAEGFTPPEPQNYEELLQDDDENGSKVKKKKKKKKASKDPFEGVSEDDLLSELALLNVIREIPEEELIDWPGAPAYNFGPYHETRLGDVKHPVIDYCVLPLGSKLVNEHAPFARSVCICGPPRSGPVFLARAVCNELKATVFDLTPQRHIGRFTNRASQNRLASVVVKLARSYAPSIILVENEAAWLKKIPPNLRRARPSKFLPIYAKILKEIRPGDRVLFLTASCEPYLAGGSFIKSFDRLLVVPEADYGTLVRAFRGRLSREHYVDRYFDVSCLAKLLAGDVPLEEAQDILEGSLTISRRMSFKGHPLTQSELLERFFERNKDLQKSLKQWNKMRYSKVPVERQRQKHEEELREAAAAATKAAKKKQKK